MSSARFIFTLARVDVSHSFRRHYLYKWTYVHSLRELVIYKNKKTKKTARRICCAERRVNHHVHFR